MYTNCFLCVLLYGKLFHQPPVFQTFVCYHGLLVLASNLSSDTITITKGRNVHLSNTVVQRTMGIKIGL